MSPFEELPFEQLANLYDEFGPGPWSRTKTRVHDEIARRVHAFGAIRLGIYVYRPTEDGSFSRSIWQCNTAGIPARNPARLGRAVELVTPQSFAPRGRLHERPSDRDGGRC